MNDVLHLSDTHIQLVHPRVDTAVCWYIKQPLEVGNHLAMFCVWRRTLCQQFLELVVKRCVNDLDIINETAKPCFFVFFHQIIRL